MPSRWGIVGTFLLLVLLLATAGSRAAAHGKEVLIELRCAAAAPASPLTQRCEATVRAANDGDPISDARLTLSAERPAKGDQVSGARMDFTGDPARFVGTLILPAYGTWVITAAVEAPAEGRIQLSQEILPPTGAASPAAEVRASLLVAFNPRDVANIAALLVHLAGTGLLFAATGAVLLAGMVAPSALGSSLRRRVARWYPRSAAGSFALIGASGLYNALYNAPTRVPGLLRPADLATLPFGKAYLAVFAVKMVLALALAGGTLRLAVLVRRGRLRWIAPIAGGAPATAPAVSPPPGAWSLLRADPCVRLAAANLLLGSALMVSVVVLDYLHLLAHAGVFFRP